jgi:hypothetical protein
MRGVDTVRDKGKATLWLGACHTTSSGPLDRQDEDLMRGVSTGVSAYSERGDSAGRNPPRAQETNLGGRDSV